MNGNDSGENYKQYLATLSNKSCRFHAMREDEVIQIIDRMENKSCSGHDSILNMIVQSTHHYNIPNVILGPILHQPQNIKNNT